MNRCQVHCWPQRLDLKGEVQTVATTGEIRLFMVKIRGKERAQDRILRSAKFGDYIDEDENSKRREVV